RHGAFVLVVAVDLGGVEPAALRRLGGGNVLGGAGEDVFQLLPALAVIFLAVDRRQEERGKAVTVHVAAGLGGVIVIADKTLTAAALRRSARHHCRRHEGPRLIHAQLQSAKLMSLVIKRTT